jgi:hypothetical protein
MNLNDMDMMTAAFDKQDLNNKNEGLSMKELFEQKRRAAEEKLEAAGGMGKGPK